MLVCVGGVLARRCDGAETSADWRQSPKPLQKGPRLGLVRMSGKMKKRDMKTTC